MPSLPTLPTGPAVGDPTTSTWADEVSAVLAFLNNPPEFRGAQNTTATSLTNGTFTLVGFDTNLRDTAGGHSTISNTDRYVAQYTGTYQFTGRIAFPVNSTGGRAIMFTLPSSTSPDNSTNVQVAAAAGVAYTIAEVNSRIALTVGQYISVLAYQSSGSTLSTVLGYSSFEALWIHP